MNLQNYLSTLIPEPSALSLPPFLPLLLLVPLLLLIRRKRRVGLIHRALSHKHVWVIGASRGLGYATALDLARRGARVSISARSEKPLQKLAQQLKALSALGAVVPLDVSSDLDTLRHAFRHVTNLAPLDILIVNAAVNNRALPFSKLSPELIDAVVNTNFRAVLRLFHVALPHLLSRPSDTTLCAISSLTAYRGVPGASVYGATKAALTNLCQSLSVELYASNVNVVCIHPGFIATPALDEMHHPKPFLLSEEQAAQHVSIALAFRNCHYAFPWIMENIVMRFSRILPTPLYNFILHHTA